MKSPYSTRRRKQVSKNETLISSQYSSQPNSSSSSKVTYVIETNKNTKIDIDQEVHFETPQPQKRKLQAMTRIMSQQDLSNVELQSSSINQSSHLHRKSKREVTKSKCFENYVISMSHEHSNALAFEQIQKENDKNHIKIDGDQQNLIERKSYKRLNSLTCLGVPYRKCHSSMQQKVVCAINKIKNGKDSQREIEALMEKTKKVSTKELSNKYFVSGIQLLFNFSKQHQYRQFFTSDLRKKISLSLEDLKNRILSQLDNTKAFQPTEIQFQENSFRKVELVKRIYRILRKKLRNLKREEVQKRALQATDRFMQNKFNNLQTLYEELGSS